MQDWKFLAKNFDDVNNKLIAEKDLLRLDEHISTLDYLEKERHCFIKVTEKDNEESNMDNTKDELTVSDLEEETLRKVFYTRRRAAHKLYYLQWLVFLIICLSLGCLLLYLCLVIYLCLGCLLCHLRPVIYLCLGSLLLRPHPVIYLCLGRPLFRLHLGLVYLYLNHPFHLCLIYLCLRRLLCLHLVCLCLHRPLLLHLYWVCLCLGYLRLSCPGLFLSGCPQRP